MSRFVVLLVVAVCSSQSLAQIIYEPVKYQHREGDQRYYYGGDSSLVHREAQREIYDRSHGGYGVFSGSDHSRQREMFGGREAVYVDGYLRDVSSYGYTANDAREEAMSRVARYFRKSEILAAGERQLDGSIVVPADVNVAGRLYVREVAPTAKPSTTKGAIIIIPKKLLDKPLKSDNRVSIAQ